MSYAINLTNGTKLTDIVDGSINQTATDLTLIGRNSTNYGTFFNDNLVFLLENFANNTEPTRPLTGQLWYDTSDNILKVYNGQGFVPTGNTIVSNEQPTGLTTGGLWVNNVTRQIYFNDGGTSPVLAGPIYTTQQGKSGFEVVDVLDTNKITRTIVKLNVANTLIGIFSKAEFTPDSTIEGFSGPIQVGFNVSDFPGISFDVEVSTALGLTSTDGGDPKTEGSFLSAVDPAFTNQPLTIANDNPLILGSTGGSEIVIDSNKFRLISADRDVELVARNVSGLYINGADEFVGIFNSSPETTLDVNGDATIRGNLIVTGTTTTISSSELAIKDATIELGVVELPDVATDSTADGGGILLHGDTNKTITWVNSTDSWTSSEHINIPSNKSYKLNGTSVIYSNTGTLTTSIVSAPNLTQVGALDDLHAARLYISNSTIQYSHAGDADGSITLLPLGSGTVDVSEAKITNVGAPYANTDAATKYYVDSTVASAPLGISLKTNGMTDLQIASAFLTAVFPPGEYVEGTVCRVIATDESIIPSPPTISQINLKTFILISGEWTHAGSDTPINI